MVSLLEATNAYPAMTGGGWQLHYQNTTSVAVVQTKSGGNNSAEIIEYFKRNQVFAKYLAFGGCH